MKSSSFGPRGIRNCPRIVQEAFTAGKALLAVGGEQSPLSKKDIGSFVGECNNAPGLAFVGDKLFRG